MPFPLAVPLALGAVRVGAAVLARSRAVSVAKVAVNVTKTGIKSNKSTVIKLSKNPGVKTSVVKTTKSKAGTTVKGATAVAAPSLASKIYGFTRAGIATAARGSAGPVGTGVAAVGALALAKMLANKNKTGAGPGGSAGGGKGKGKGDGASKSPKTPPKPEPKDYSFNLPPHQWSLPTRAQDVIPGDVGGQGYAYHGNRRGRIWYYDNAATTTSVDRTTGEVTTVGEKRKTETGTKTYKPKGESIVGDSTYKYGFQFLWNPESISVSVNRNMDITPSASDVYTSVSGAFPGQESVSFSIVLDRTNDFACIRNFYHNAGVLNDGNYVDFVQYYANGGKHPKARVEDYALQIKKLAELGTMADLEYLFKAINGDGKFGDQAADGWTNLLGKKTADLGYLQPTLLAFELGGDTNNFSSMNSLSYVGWASALSINHTSFAENMVPLRTTVSISFDCFAGHMIV
jgi:hypothetical protein